MKYPLMSTLGAAVLCACVCVTAQRTYAYGYLGESLSPPETISTNNRSSGRVTFSL